jgi:tRNA threonylcarbamoyladenosine biosynthesis protein TsaE
MDRITVTSHSPSATRDLAAALGRRLRPGDALCLDGDLGAGKTTFVAALVEALGGQDEVTSPTFTLENRYRLDHGDLDSMLHCDLYRPGEDARRDLLPSMLEARDEGALLAVEWADPVKDELEPYLLLRMEVLGARTRRLELSSRPADWPGFVELRPRWETLSGGDRP